jgi:3-phosphoshikimate 1-carboxyvinyltransferase
MRDLMSAAPLSYPEKLTITPVHGPLSGTVRVPGSKSLTNRALILGAAVGVHTWYLTDALRSEDTEVMVRALQQLGYEIETDWDADPPEIRMFHPEQGITVNEADLFVANSGTSMRFLTALVCLGHGRYRLDGVARMRERPIQDLLDALGQLGVRAYSESGNGCPPVIVEAQGLDGGHVRIKGDVSSQFLSALLLVAPCARQDLTIEVVGELVSEPYVDMTVALLRRYGYVVEAGPAQYHLRYHIPAQRRSSVCAGTRIEPDASAASYFFAAAAITGGTVTIPGLGEKNLQGDVHFVDVLQQMGSRAMWTRDSSRESITVTGGPLHGIDVDMNDISDTVMTLGVVACFADGPTTIRNVAHIRHKETDRIAALATELRRIGAEVTEREDGLTIVPRPLHGAEIETYNDHRMAMSLALVGLKVPGIVIKNPGCVAKTYPRFFDDLERLRSNGGASPVA